MGERRIDDQDIPREYERLDEAVRLVRAQLLAARDELMAMDLDCHLVTLEDRSFLAKIRAQVERDRKPVEVVVAQVVDGYYRALSMVADVHLRERAAVVRDIGRRLVDSLAALPP